MRAISLLLVTLLTGSIFLSFLGISCARAGDIELPVPRDKTLIYDSDTKFTIWDRFNPFIPSGVQWLSGWHFLCNEYDWYETVTVGWKLWRIKGWKYEDNYTKFTLYIKPGVKWNDGNPYTSKDYNFTIWMLKNYTSLSGSAYVNEYIDYVETPDDLTVVFHLKKPNPRFAYTFCMWRSPLPAIVPEHIWKGKNPEEFSNFPPVDTGPYKLFSVNPDLRYFIWIRDDDYWAKDEFPGFESCPKYVFIKEASPADIQAQEILRGDVDTWTSIKWEIARMLPVVNPDIFLHPWPRYGGPEGIGLNHDHYPFNLREFRWALSYAINREKLVELYPAGAPGYTAPVTTSLPFMYAYNVSGNVSLERVAPELVRYIPVIEEYRKKIKEQYGWEIAYNLTKAAEILDSLNFIDRDNDGIRETPNGTKLSFTLVTDDFEEHTFACYIIKEDFQKIGIGIELVVTTNQLRGPAFVQPGKFDITYGGLVGYSFDIVRAFDPFHSKWIALQGGYGGWVGGCRYRNKTLDNIIDQLWAIAPEEYDKVDPLVKEALWILQLDMPQIPAFVSNSLQPRSNMHWTNWPSSENWYWDPYPWQPLYFFVILNLKPKIAVEITYSTVWFLKDVDAFTASDGKTYGPFLTGTSASIPLSDAEKLVSEGKASYTPPTETSILETLGSIQSATSRVESTVNTFLTSIMPILYGIIILQIIVLIVIIYMLITTRKRVSS